MLNKCFIWLFAPLLCLVLTSCASLPMTPMRSYTRCWSWPSARAARVSACSDSSITGTVFPLVPVQTSTAHSSALVPCIHLYLPDGLLGRENTQTPSKYSVRMRGCHRKSQTAVLESGLIIWTVELLYVHKISHFVKTKKEATNCWKSWAFG